MQLLGFEQSRIVYFTQRIRPEGQLYLPDAVQKLASRYSFAKFPSVEDLTRGAASFLLGKFREIQINELQLYPDGIIVIARAPTEVLDAFISDLLSWSEEEFGLIEPATVRHEKFIESSIIVKSTTDLALSLAPRNDVAQILNKRFPEHTVSAGAYQLSGFFLDGDAIKFATRPKPMRFVLERRVGIPFSENVFYSAAPLHTEDHLEVLSEFEALLLQPSRL
jgi:hypothetical protein